VPTITLEGDANGAPHPDPGSYAGKFSGPHSHRTITGGIGNLPQEAPEASAQAVIDVNTQEGALMSEATFNAPLTVVLVHGAFADSSSWDGVIEIFQAAGSQVTAVPNPLRGIFHDSAYVASFMRQIPGLVLGEIAYELGRLTGERAVGDCDPCDRRPQGSHVPSGWDAGDCQHDLVRSARLDAARERLAR
jgi:hypothetical protein